LAFSAGGGFFCASSGEVLPREIKHGNCKKMEVLMGKSTMFDGGFLHCHL
jgi:hypothetical protein